MNSTGSNNSMRRLRDGGMQAFLRRIAVLLFLAVPGCSVQAAPVFPVMQKGAGS